MRGLLVRLLSSIPPRLIHTAQRVRHSHPLLRRLTGVATRWLRDDTAAVAAGPARGLVIDAAAAKLGYTLGTNEPVVQERLVHGLGAGHTFYDIGANVGFFTLLAARLVGPHGRVYAFEPVPELAAVLRQNVARNGFDNVVVLEVAAFSHSGIGTLDLPDDPTGARVVPEESGEGAGSAESVELVAIDDLLDRGDVRAPDLVKIDVEGAEGAVVEGMRRTLRAARPAIICELHGPQPWFEAVMRDAGYDVQVLEDGGGIDNPHVLAEPRSVTA